VPQDQSVPEALHHLAVALSGHVRRLHFQGVPVPRSVEELAVFLHRLVRSRQDPSILAMTAETSQYSRMPDQLLITKGEAAERLGVSVRTLERLVATGRLPQVHVERLARFRVKDLEVYVEGLETSAHDQGDEEADVDGDAAPSAGTRLARSVGDHHEAGLAAAPGPQSQQRHN